MDATRQSSVLGPATFFGLSLYVLVTSTPPEQQFANPADMMNVDEVSTGPALAALFAHFPDIGPPESPPRAPRIFVFQTVAPAEPADRAARASARAVVPLVTFATADLAQPTGPVLTEITLSEVDARPSDEVPDTAPGPTPDPRFAPPSHDWFEVTGDNVNVRTGPGTENPSVTQLNRGMIGLRIAVDGKWTLLQFPLADFPVQGWMSSGFLDPFAP